MLELLLCQTNWPKNLLLRFLTIYLPVIGVGQEASDKVFVAQVLVLFGLYSFPVGFLSLVEGFDYCS